MLHISEQPWWDLFNMSWLRQISEPARASSQLSTSKAVLSSQFMSKINLPKIHTLRYIPVLLFTWASFRSKQQTYCSVTSTEQRRGLFHNVLHISPELQLHSQAPLCDVAEPSLQHWHPDCGLWSVRAWGAVTACYSFSRSKKKTKNKKHIYIYICLHKDVINMSFKFRLYNKRIVYQPCFWITFVLRFEVKDLQD